MPKHPNGDPVRGNPYRIRDLQATALTEIWLVTAVVTILLIRGYLHLTGYPQVGGDTLHIAHMLYGGLGLTIALGMLFIFAHPVWKPIAALVGGAGFGTFIDELGKFITDDNDYFYRPTIALIYGVFVVLFIAARYVEGKREPTTADHLFYAVEGVQWGAIGKLDRHRRDRALHHLEESDVDSGFRDWLREMLESAEVIEDSEHSRLLAWRERLEDFYWKVVGNQWILRIVLGLFVLKAIQLLGLLAIGLAGGTFSLGDGFSVSEWGAGIAAAVGGVIALWGVLQLVRRRRVAALHAFAASVLVSLLFGQFFAFAVEQFVAIGSLLFELVVLGVLRFAISAEAERQHIEGVDDGEIRAEGGLGGLVS